MDSLKLDMGCFTFSFKARIMPLNVAATSVKFAIPPPITRALFWPSGSAVAHYRKQKWKHQPLHPEYTSRCSIKNWSILAYSCLPFARVIMLCTSNLIINNAYINNNSGILQHLLLIRCSTVFCIVSELRGITKISNLFKKKFFIK